jgi:hypothetical protein
MLTVAAEHGVCITPRIISSMSETEIRAVVHALTAKKTYKTSTG